MDYSALAPNDLLSVCVTVGDSAAWEEFIRWFNPLITRVLFRVAYRFGETSNSLIDDLVQEAYLKICADDCKLLKAFEPQQPASIFGFLKVPPSKARLKPETMTATLGEFSPAHDFFDCMCHSRNTAIL